jgi:hypothetical protein
LLPIGMNNYSCFWKTYKRQSSAIRSDAHDPKFFLVLTRASDVTANDHS